MEAIQTNGAELTTGPKAAQVRALTCGLELMGWTILNLDLDLSRETARLEVKRLDGLYLALDARNGAASVTREMHFRETVSTGRRGDRCIVERCRARFLGRERMLGARQGLRWLCGYIADNATRPALASDVRGLLTPLMDGSCVRGVAS